MKVVISGKTYTEIRDLSFEPETDIVGETLPINQFSVTIITTDDIKTGIFASLYDNMDNLWAKYWIDTADRVSSNQVNIIAKSLIELLERITLPAAMYNGYSVPYVVSSIFSSVTAKYPNVYELDESFSSDTVSGYVPEQSGRDRLQWVCFCIGAHVKAYFNDIIQILPIVDEPTLIPIEKTFWKPEISYDDYVTAIKATAYAYIQGEPQNTDKWVEVNGVYYIETSQEFELQNPFVPESAPVKEIVFNNLKIINNENVSDILSRVSTYYFQRERISANIVNNAEHYPAERVMVSTDANDFVLGYIKECDFTFGLQAKSKIDLVQTETIHGEDLTINYWYGLIKLKTSRYKLPIDYHFNIENPYFDRTNGGIRRIYRPLNEYATGTMVSGGVEIDQYYDIALEYNGYLLDVISVDKVVQNDERVRIS